MKSTKSGGYSFGVKGGIGVITSNFSSRLGGGLFFGERLDPDLQKEARKDRGAIGLQCRKS